MDPEQQLDMALDDVVEQQQQQQHEQHGDTRQSKSPLPRSPAPSLARAL